VKNIYNRQVKFQKVMKTNYDIMYLALIEELGELVASFGYSDWKQTVRDEDNIRIEAMDICIFAINCHYYLNRRYSATQGVLTNLIISDIQLIKQIQTLIANDKYLEIVALIFAIYPDVKTNIIGKQALNTFRQDNGYKLGTYKKLWNGQEDNVTMLEYVKNNLNATFEDIYTYLSETYASL